MNPSRTSPIIKSVRQQIQHWDHVRKTDTAIDLMTSGYYFEIFRGEFENWETIVKRPGVYSPQVHVYLAIQENELIFYLVDSVTDAEWKEKGDDAYIINKNLFEKPFRHEIRSNSAGEIPPWSISKTEASNRIFGWMFYAGCWFDAQPKESILRVFSFPFHNLTELFNKNGAVSVLCFFGLIETDSPNAYQIDLVLGGLRSSTDSRRDLITFKNVSIPHPPFPADHNFNLLV